MRAAFAHEAVLVLEPGSDPRAPGGAITVALCGHLEHEPPCPLAPHHTSATADGTEVALRVLFATEPTAELEVRGRIGAALATAEFTDPSGDTSRWRVHHERRGTLTDEDAGPASELISS